VIVADPDREECIAKIRSLIDKRPEILMFNDKVYTNYSVGYHFAQVGDSTELRDLLTEADGYMYEAKRAGKNRISGDEDKI
jgi:PleD family two-component response regulator